MDRASILGKACALGALIALGACATPNDSKLRPGGQMPSDLRALACEGMDSLDARPVLNRGRVPIFPVARTLPSKDGFPRDASAHEVTTTFTIDREGQTQGVWSTHTIPDSYARHANHAITGWVFEPVTRNGEPVEVECTYGFNFTAERDPIR